MAARRCRDGPMRAQLSTPLPGPRPVGSPGASPARRGGACHPVRPDLPVPSTKQAGPGVSGTRAHSPLAPRSVAIGLLITVPGLGRWCLAVILECALARCRAKRIIGDVCSLHDYGPNVQLCERSTVFRLRWRRDGACQPGAGDRSRVVWPVPRPVRLYPCAPQTLQAASPQHGAPAPGPPPRAARRTETASLNVPESRRALPGTAELPPEKDATERRWGAAPGAAERASR